MPDPTIPGLEPPPPPGGRGPMARAVERQLAALTAAGITTDHHAATVELVRVLAGATDRSALRDKAYGTAQVARELREALAALPTPPAQTGDAFDALVALLRASPVRDLTDAVADQ